MRLFNLLLFGLLLISAFGCQKNVEDQYTQKLDSTIAVLEAANQAVSAIDVEKLQSMKPILDKYYEFYSKEYDDIENRDFYTNELMDMANCKKYVGRTKSNIAVWKQELEVTQNQLKALKHDYENYLISQKDLLKHLDTELFASEEINKTIQKNIGSTSACMRNFKELTDKLDSVRIEWLQSREIE